MPLAPDSVWFIASPRHLVLGRPALDLARADLDAKREEFDAWEATTLSADFPQTG